jgi:hypothetical protein
MQLFAGRLQGRHFQMTDHNQPYTLLQKVVDVVFNFLTAVGVIAAAGIAGYVYVRYL